MLKDMEIIHIVSTDGCIYDCPRCIYKKFDDRYILNDKGVLSRALEVVRKIGGEVEDSTIEFETTMNPQFIPSLRDLIGTAREYFEEVGLICSHPKIVSELKEGLDFLTVSLDYDQKRSRPKDKGYEHTLRIASESNIEVYAVSVLNRNYSRKPKEVVEWMNSMMNKYGNIVEWYLFPEIPVNKKRDELILTRNELVDFLYKIDETLDPNNTSVFLYCFDTKESFNQIEKVWRCKEEWFDINLDEIVWCDFFPWIKSRKNILDEDFDLIEAINEIEKRGKNIEENIRNDRKNFEESGKCFARYYGLKNRLEKIGKL